MPDIVPPVPTLTAEDRSGSPDSTILGRKSRKPRKKATAPKPERAPRTKPARTLRVRVAELGPTALDALDLICKRDPNFADKVRDALNANDAATEAGNKANDAEDAYNVAKDAFERANREIESCAPDLSRLDAVAKSLAHALGDVPDADEDTTFDGSGTPRDTGRSEGDEAL